MSIINQDGVEVFKGAVLTAPTYHYIWDGDYSYDVTVWNEEKGEPESYCVEHSYGLNRLQSEIDATPEVVAKWDAYRAARIAEMEHKERVRRVQKALASRKMWMELTPITAIPYTIVRRKLKSKYELYKLLLSNPRSAFRLSLKKQVMDWLDDPNPKYDFPLSPKQMMYLQPYKPY